MEHDGIPGPLLFNLNKESPFSFKCQVCSACCYNKAIPVAPYEALRLARNLGLTTTEFIRTCIEEDDHVLRNRPDGSCLFLGPGGCSVHPDRPLVCRLFPLGLIADKEGGIRYGIMPLHPDCLGHFDADGTVKSYLESQGLERYFQYDAIYEAVSRRIEKKMKERRDNETGIPRQGEPDPSRPESSSPSKLLPFWLDLDKTVAAFCLETKRSEPKSLDEAVSIHLEAIEEWLVPPRKRPRSSLRNKGISRP